jgi:hypothetical protein
MVHTLGVPAMQRGEPIFSNFRINYWNWRPLTGWGQFLEARDGLVLLDEVSSWVPSRESSKLPAEVLSHCNQLRKANITLGWSGPAWGRCDKAVREVTHAVVWCRGYANDRHVRQEDGLHRWPLTGRIAYDLGGKPLTVNGWSNRRLFRWRWYDKLTLGDGVEGEVLDSPPKGVRTLRSLWHWRPAHGTHRLYDTAESVLALDGVHSGRCLHCGGRRAEPKCECVSRNDKILARAL